MLAPRLVVRVSLALALASCASPPLPPPPPTPPAPAPDRCDDVATCEASCKHGHTKACAEAAARIERIPTEADLGRLLDVLGRACDGSHAESCNRLARVYQDAPSLPRDEARASSLLGRACDLGDAASCLTLSEPSRSVPGAEARLARALALAEAGCEAGEGKACGLLSALHLGLGGPADPAKWELYARKAGDALEASCLAGVAGDCAVGFEQIAGARRDGDLRRASRLLIHGCQLGDGEACFSLAGLAGDAPASQRVKLYQIACDGGREEGCFALAAIQRESASASAQGLAGSLSIETGLRLARAHCEIGDERGCTSLAKRLTRETTPPADAAKTVDLLEKVCERGAPTTCDALADALIDGPEALRDHARGLRLKKKACDQGYPFACPEPWTKLGVYPPLGAIFLDRRTGLEWAPSSRRAGSPEAGREECKAVHGPGRAPFRLPSRDDLRSLAEREGELRVFARASLPRSGLVLSGEEPWAMHLPDGHLVDSNGSTGIAFCVRKAERAAGKKGLALTLRMDGADLAYAVRDARGKVLFAATFVRPQEAPGPLPWEADQVPGPVDVDVAPEVPFGLAVRFLDGSRQRGLGLVRIAIDGPR